MKVGIQATHDTKYEIEMGTESTVLELKHKISDHEKESKGTELATESIRLIFAGRILKDDEILSALNIKDGNTIHMVKSQKKAPAAPLVSQPAPPQQPASQAPPMMQTGSIPDMASMMGMGGFDDPDMMDASQEMLQNPEIRQQMMDMMTANPQLLRTAMSMNPMFQQMPPEMQELMLNPEMIRMAMEMSSRVPSGNAGGMSPDLQNMIQALQAGGPPAQQQQASSEPPEVRFASQLQQLNDMGFWDKEENIRALLMTGGNVNAAVERLLNSMQ
jgi:ubiquilin